MARHKSMQKSLKMKKRVRSGKRVGGSTMVKKRVRKGKRQ